MFVFVRVSFKLLTVIVDFAIIVLVPVFHQFLDVVLSYWLSCRFQHHLQLIQVDVAICVSAHSIFINVLINRCRYAHTHREGEKREMERERSLCFDALTRCRAYMKWVFEIFRAVRKGLWSKLHAVLCRATWHFVIRHGERTLLDPKSAIRLLGCGTFF